VKLEISFDQRRKGGELGRERLQAAAKSFLGAPTEGDDDAGFTIVTGSGKRLTAAEIRVSDSRDFNPYGNSIFRIDAFEALLSYYEELEASGVLEQ
jgi:hypothetical protein